MAEEGPFATIAREARLIATSQPLGSIDYARMIARLAEAMERLEYNTALQLAIRDVNNAGATVHDYLRKLRREVP